jgi:gliding motility-associated-like protein
LISETLGSYGVEFSPSGNIAYITFGFTHGFSSLIQFDLTATNISNNPTILYQRLDWSDPKKFDNITGLQLASNSKIYCALPGRNFIGAINNPQKLGLACDFQLNSVLLAPGSSCALGLPPFIQSFFNVGIKIQNNCVGEISSFSLSDNQNTTSPNGDGFNDYWNIKGVNASFNAKTIIYIFDRYGKLITQIKPTSQGWNGTLNGQQMPATDYWYSVQLEDGRILKGHFSLKR